MAAIALSIWWPLAAVYVIILFDLYWLLRWLPSNLATYIVEKFQQALKLIGSPKWRSKRLE